MRTLKLTKLRRPLLNRTLRCYNQKAGRPTTETETEDAGDFLRDYLKHADEKSLHKLNSLLGDVIKEGNVTNNPVLEEKKKDKREAVQRKLITPHPAFLYIRNEKSKATVYTRGDIICVRTNAWEFVGPDFSMLTPSEAEKRAFNLLNNSFNFFDLSESGFLTAFSAVYQTFISFDIKTEQDQIEAKNFELQVEVEVDHTQEPVQQFRVQLFIPQESGEDKAIVSGIFKTMNDCMKDLKPRIPSNMTLKACWTCSAAMYSPLGISYLGGLGCFKSQPELRNVSSLKNVFVKWDTRDQMVMETYLCPSWEGRTVKQIMPKYPIPEGKSFRFEEEPPQ